MPKFIAFYEQKLLRLWTVGITLASVLLLGEYGILLASFVWMIVLILSIYRDTLGITISDQQFRIKDFKQSGVHPFAEVTGYKIDGPVFTLHTLAGTFQYNTTKWGESLIALAGALEANKQMIHGGQA